MFDVGFFELCIIGVVALLVIGPDKLPKAARTAGLWVGRAKRMVARVKSDIDAEIRQDELKELQEFREAKDAFSNIKDQVSSVTKDLKSPVLDSKADKSSNSSGPDKDKDAGEQPAKPQA